MTKINFFQIRIFPYGPYFFGQEAIRIFGNKQPYFRKSRALPSQTTLLGMVRRMLCIQNGISNWSDIFIPLDKQESARQLIGGSGFHPDLPSYGCIKSLSSVSLLFDERTFYPAHRSISTDMISPICFGAEKDTQYIDVMGGQVMRNCNSISNFSAKLDFQNAYYCFETDTYVGEDNFLCRNTLTHSSKSKGGQSERTAYFKDEVIQYHQGIFLQFFVGLELQPGTKFRGTAAVLGADQRMCYAEVIPVDAMPAFSFSEEDLSKITGPALLLSDCFPADDYRSSANVVLSGGHRMTYLQTKVNTSSYASASRNPVNGDKPGFAMPIHVLNAGGIIWPAKGKSFADILKHPYARTAGFNYVAPINLTQV